MIRRLLLAAAVFTVADPAVAQGPYPNMAPADSYLMPNAAHEVELARSAAPESVSGKATVLVLGKGGYETAVKGSNGFVCIVARSWGAGFNDSDFWNPKVRAPICHNPASARSVLPTYLSRTRWVMEGASKDEVRERIIAGVASAQFSQPEIGSMCYMMSPKGYLSDATGGPWRPHVMYFVPRTANSEWGANLPGSPMIGNTDDAEQITVFLTPVSDWSDGSSGSSHEHG